MKLFEILHDEYAATTVWHESSLSRQHLGIMPQTSTADP